MSIQPGFYIDFATQRLPPDSNLEKTFVRRYYRAARRDKENGSRWLKAPKDGGLKPYERRANYMSWISRARREFLENHQGDIWKRHQQCGFNLSIDGSENHKLHFRDVQTTFLLHTFKNASSLSRPIIQLVYCMVTIFPQGQRANRDNPIGYIEYNRMLNKHCNCDYEY